MKIFSILRRRFAGRRIDAGICDAAWIGDPYAHPDIAVMSERERADLPPFHLPVAHVSEACRSDRCMA
jgi:hypothetical protein